MNDEEKFHEESKKEILAQATNSKLNSLTNDWLLESAKAKYSYHFSWLGRPIIQYPQDIIGLQEILWKVKPDLIIETGIARGGSLIFLAGILELIAVCGGSKNAKVIGIDIDIREHNKKAILQHPLSKRIEMIEGSSVDSGIFEQVKKKIEVGKKTLVCLDSNHTYEHVKKELQLYGPLISKGSYIIVFDTVVEDLPENFFSDRSWGPGNSPKTAVSEYIEELEKQSFYGADGTLLKFQIDREIENKLLITVAPSGYLERI